MSDLTQPFGHVKIAARGLIIAGEIAHDEWLAVGKKITQILNGSTWALGDWFAYGAGRGDYGESFMAGIVLTGRSYDSLSQAAARVSQAFPYASRAIAVPWSHYREALRLPEQDREEMLRASAEGKWSRDQFSQEIERLLATVAGRPVRQVYQVDHHKPIGKRTASRENRHVRRCPNCGHRWTARLRKGMLQ